jgi:arylformamidase
MVQSRKNRAKYKNDPAVQSSSKRHNRKHLTLPTLGWIDVSVPLRSGMVRWPDNPPVHIERILDMERGDVSNVSTISMGSHTGTHVDSPIHFIRSGMGIDKMPLSATVGPARVIEIHDPELIKPEELRPHRIRRAERILFKTRNSERCWKTNDFVEDFVYLSTDAALFLITRQVQTIGVDYLSIGGYNKNGAEVHRALLEAGVWIIEGLDLSRVQSGAYELICLPLKIEQGDGAPARAILRREIRKKE